MGYQKISWLIGWSSFPPLIWMGRDWGPAGNLEAKKEQVMLKCWFALMAKPLLHPVDQTYPNKISWLLVSTPLTNISQLERLFPIYGKIKAMFQTHRPVSEITSQWLMCSARRIGDSVASLPQQRRMQLQSSCSMRRQQPDQPLNHIQKKHSLWGGLAVASSSLEGLIHLEHFDKL